MRLAKVKNLKVKSDSWGHHLTLDCVLVNQKGDEESGVLDWDIPTADWSTLMDILQRMVDDSYKPKEKQYELH